LSLLHCFVAEEKSGVDGHILATHSLKTSLLLISRGVDVQSPALTMRVDLDSFFSGIPDTANDRSFLRATLPGGQQIRKEENIHVNGWL
jgi:hypothetical protein